LKKDDPLELLNAEISQNIEVNGESMKELASNIQSSSPTIITPRGMRLFDYNELREKYDRSTPIIRDLMLPYSRTQIKEDFFFYSTTGVGLGTILHTFLHLSIF